MRVFPRLTAVSSLLISITIGDPIMFDLDPNEKECFWQNISVIGDLYHARPVTINYEVLFGGELDISFSLWDTETGQLMVQRTDSFDLDARYDRKYDPKQNPDFDHSDDELNTNMIDDDELDEEEKEVGYFEFKPKHNFKICFDNTMPTKDYRRIWLDVNLHLSINNLKSIHEDMQDQQFSEEMNKIYQQTRDMLANLQHIEQRLHYLKRRKERHQYTLDSSNTRGNWLRVLQVSLIVIITVAQNFVIRYWFQSHSGGNHAFSPLISPMSSRNNSQSRV